MGEKKQDSKFNIKFLGLPDSLLNYEPDMSSMIKTCLKDFRSEEKLKESVSIAIRRIANLALGYKPVTIVEII